MRKHAFDIWGVVMGFGRYLPVSLCVLTLALTGCGAGPGTPTHHPIDNSHYSGSVHGGQQPVVGATVQLYTVGTTADGSAATPLLTSTVTSDATGSFTITGLYSCTSATQVYIVATGGNPGLSTANPNVALMAALGPCSSLTSSTFISINELTTAAAVSALAPFMTSITAIGSSPSDATQLANAFILANEYVNTTTGTSPGATVPSGSTVPTTELNTLADILSACINSAGGTAGDGSLCGDLFSLTTVSPAPAPTNTIQAMLNIASNPNLSTSALYTLAPPTPPFQPTLTSAPANFAVSLQSVSPIEADPSAVNFLNVTVGTSSLIQTVTFQNNTGMSRVSLVGPNATDFGIGNFSPTYVGICGYTGNYPDPCWIQVYARPSATGVLNASIEVDYNYGNSTLYIPLSVTGIASAPNSILSNSFVNFPPTIAGSSSTPVPVFVNNTSSAALTVSGITINGVIGNNFTQTNNCSSVAVNASCTIYVTFSPTNSGVQSATLQVASITSGPNTVALSGTGVSLGDSPALWPWSLSYTIWGANEDLVLINPGTSSISTSSLDVGTTGGLEEDHAYSATNNCGSTVASGASCTFSIANTAVHPLSFYTAGFSSVTGQAFVSGTSLNSFISTQNAAYLYQSSGGINGNGISGTITLPTQQVGLSETASIQLANIGSGSPAASLAIGGANPGDFAVSAVQPTVSSTPSSFCPAANTGTLPCTITVTYTPTAAGTRTAKISLDSNGISTGQYIYVTGTAVGPGPYFYASPASVSMQSHIPTTPDSESAGLANVQLINKGTTTLNLGATFTGTNASDMSVVSNDCTSVAPNSFCYVDISFSAPALGNSYTANLLASDANSAFSLSIPITASTVYWPIAASPTVFNFGNQAIGTTSTRQFFRLGDSNLAPLGHPISVSLQPSSNFTLPDGSSCPASTTQPCQLTVAFDPQTTGGISETLTATDQTTGLQATITLDGTGTN